MSSGNDPNFSFDEKSTVAGDHSIETANRIGFSESSGSPHIALISGSGISLGAKTTSLLHSRLRAVAILILIVNVIFLVGSLAAPFLGGGSHLFGDFPLYRVVVVVRMLFVATVLIILFGKSNYSETFLRCVEYLFFGTLILFWVYARYSSVLFDIQAGENIDLRVDDRESLFQLWLIMFVHSLLIPHSWKGAAGVILSMALSPAIALALLSVFHPELKEELSPLWSIENLSIVVLIVLVGATLAIYGSSVLNAMRREVHNAKKFGQYQLIKQLGVGGMGEVYLAHHALLKRPCALKLIRPEAADNPTALARFEREVQATAQLTHPNTIEIYDYGHTEEGTFYYVMELLPGLSLQEMISQHGPMIPGRAIYLLRQICSALENAHASGLVHRDLKPANLFISERGGLRDFIKVLDFGLVKLTMDREAEQITADQSISGTPAYMSPEQTLADKNIDGRTDIYAVGVIAYQMLTGRLPFEGKSPVAVMVAHSSQEVQPPSKIRSDIPEDLEQIILRCLAKKPADRYPDAASLEQAFANCDTANDWNSKLAHQWWDELVNQP